MKNRWGLTPSIFVGTDPIDFRSEAQLAFLLEKGCNEMQGYYFSKPLSVDQFEAFVRGKNKA